MNYYSYEYLSSIENLCQAWREFGRGKLHKPDVSAFALNLSTNIYDLHRELRQSSYRHGAYQAFKINDPKPRDIHKATVRDRLVHHAVYRVLYPFFNQKFIHDSYSCRNHKGTHHALRRLRQFSLVVSRNNHGQCWVLKCDIRKFFASIDHFILLDILRRQITDQEIINLLGEIINSFNSGRAGAGLPLGNLTSQLLVNVYLNEFDWFVKHYLKAKHYIRYADDFLILHQDRKVLFSLLPVIQEFLNNQLKLSLHPDKILLKTIYSGADFLGWMHFHDHRVLRTITKKRMFKKLLAKSEIPEVRESYLGLLAHGNAKQLQNRVKASPLDI